MKDRALHRLVAALALLLPVAGEAKRQPPPPPPAVSAGALIDNVTGLTLDADRHVVRFTGVAADP